MDTENRCYVCGSLIGERYEPCELKARVTMPLCWECADELVDAANRRRRAFRLLDRINAAPSSCGMEMRW